MAEADPRGDATRRPLVEARWVRQVEIAAGHPVIGVSLSHDAGLALVCSHPKALTLVDANSGWCVATLDFGDEFVQEVQASSWTGDPSRIVCAYFGTGAALARWDARRGHLRRFDAGCLRDVPVTGPRSLSVALSHDGSVAVSASDDNELRLWDVESGDRLRSFEPAGQPRWWDVAFSPDDRRVAAASQQGEVHLWHVSSGRHESRMRPAQTGGRDAGVASLAFGSDGRLFAANRAGRLWCCDPTTGRCSELALASAEGRIVTDGRGFLYIYRGAELRILDPTGGLSFSLEVGPDRTALAAARDGSLLACGTAQGHLDLWALEWSRLDPFPSPD